MASNENGVTEIDPLREGDPIEDEKEKLSFREKVLNVFRNITVEPCVFLIVSATMLNNIASQNLQLEKACRVNLNFPTEICDSLRLQDGVADNVYERDTQQLLAKALAWRTYITATVPCILALFVGSFSDRTGHRKLFLIIPITGQILAGINNILNVYFFYQINLEITVFSEAIIDGLTGSWCIAFLTAFAFISSITTERDRTFRMGLVGFCITLALPIGMGLSGVLLRFLGFYGVYGIAVSLHTINALYAIFVVKDPKRSSDQKEHDRRGCCHLVFIFFNFKNVMETIRVIFRKAPNKRRLRLCVLLGVVTVLFGPMQGEISIMYLSVRYRFQWDEVQYSIFQTYNLIINSIGTTFSILVLAKYLGWHDSLLVIISSLSKIAASFVYGFAQTGPIFYLGPVVDILNGTSLLAMRAILSKLVEDHELGKLSSVVGMVENLMPLLYVPMYTRVYSATMEVLPGAVFLLGALLTLPAAGVLGYVFYEHRKQVAKLKSKPIELDS